MESPRLKLHCLALAAAAIVAGCSGHQASRGENVASALDAMRAAARTHVEDLRRQAVLLEAIDGMQADLAAFDATLAQAREQVRGINANPDATRAQVEALLDGFDAARKAARLRVLQRHFEMIDITNAGEWSHLASYERDAIMAAGR